MSLKTESKDSKSNMKGQSKQRNNRENNKNQKGTIRDKKRGMAAKKKWLNRTIYEGQNASRVGRRRTGIFKIANLVQNQKAKEDEVSFKHSIHLSSKYPKCILPPTYSYLCMLHAAEYLTSLFPI